MHSVPVLLIAFCVVLSVNAFIDLEALVEALTPGPCKSCKDIGNFLREMDLNREELEEMVEYQCDIHATNPYVANVCKSSERIIEEFESVPCAVVLRRAVEKTLKTRFPYTVFHVRDERIMRF